MNAQPTRRVGPIRLHVRFRLYFLTLALAFSFDCVAEDAGQFGRVERIAQEAFLPEAGLIQFDEFTLASENPVYTPAEYGAPDTAVSVQFGGYFVGQRIGPTSQCPAGAKDTGCVTGDPARPLRIDPSSPTTLTAIDTSNPRSPSLSGSPRFNGPVSMLFDQDVAGVGLYGGYFNTERSTAIRVYDRQGNLIGGVANLGLGMEYLALVTQDGSERIAGLQFSLVGPEPAGFAIDHLSFAKRNQLDDRQLPRLSDRLPVIREPEDAEPGGIAVGEPAQARSLSDLFDRNEAAEEAPPRAATPKKSLRELFDKP
jgi:hypothetical protein